MRLIAPALFIVLVCGAATVRAQDTGNDNDDRSNSGEAATIAQQLSSANPDTRQHAAEELARLAAVDQLRLVEGYRAQEKDKGVRLALDWALYRLGRSEKLYAVVAELSGKRTVQASSYLTQLEGPQLLYPFLNNSTGKTLVGLLNVLAQLGNVETLDQIKLFKSNYDPLVAGAAKDAEAAINERIAQPPAPSNSRARVATPSSQPAEPTADEPAEKPANDPAEKPAGDSLEKPESAPADTPAKEPTP